MQPYLKPMNYEIETVYQAVYNLAYGVESYLDLFFDYFHHPAKSTGGGRGHLFTKSFSRIGEKEIASGTPMSAFGNAIHGYKLSNIAGHIINAPFIWPVGFARCSIVYPEVSLRSII